MLLCAHVSFGGSLAEETTWTKRIVEKKTPQCVGKNSEGRFLYRHSTIYAVNVGTHKKSGK